MKEQPGNSSIAAQRAHACVICGRTELIAF